MTVRHINDEGCLCKKCTAKLLAAHRRYFRAWLRKDFADALFEVAESADGEYQEKAKE